jgi:immune inhibitor A
LIFREKNLKARHLNPEIYKKVRKTRDLLKKNVDPNEFSDKGGLDLKTFNALKERRNDLQNIVEKGKKKFISQYGSLNSTPLSVGPCRKIKPVIGTKKALVLLTEFEDVKHSHEPSEFSELLFSKGSNKSMRDYYLEASWNQLDITGQVNNQWCSATGKRKDYVDEIPVNRHYPHAQKLVEETVLQAKKQGNIDFNEFAQEGKIDILIVVYSGAGLDTKLNIKYIRPHQDRLPQPLEVQDGVWVDKYCLVSELPFDDLGCYCHEVGHILGLPDLYKEGYSPVVGSWCLMAIGDHNDNGKSPAHPSAWCKLQLGWRKPQLIPELPHLEKIPAVTDDDSVIYKMEVQGSGGGEYFLLENRQQKGFDRYLPGSGLLIWHVDENKCVHQAPNSDPDHFFLTLVQSDGKDELQMDMTALIRKGGDVRNKLGGDEGDAYPGVTLNRSFDDKTHPNSDSNTGHRSMVSVTSISDSNEIMQAQMGIINPTEIEQDPTIPIKSKTSELMFKRLLALLTSSNEETPYDEGYHSGKQDIIESLIVEQGLNSYKNGYNQGYQQGYRKAWEKLTKK